MGTQLPPKKGAQQPPTSQPKSIVAKWCPSQLLLSSSYGRPILHAVTSLITSYQVRTSEPCKCKAVATPRKPTYNSSHSTSGSPIPTLIPITKTKTKAKPNANPNPNPNPTHGHLTNHNCNDKLHLFLTNKHTKNPHDAMLANEVQQGLLLAISQLTFRHLVFSAYMSG